MVLHHILKLFLKGGEYLRICSDNGALMTISPGEILRGDDSHPVSACLQQDQFGVIIGEETAVDCLHDKGPEAQRLVGGFMIEQQLNVFDLSCTTHVVEPPDELL